MVMKFKLPSKKDYFKSDKATPVEMFRMLMDQTNSNMGRVGCDLFTPNYNYFRSLYGIGFVISAIVGHVYSLVINKHDFVKFVFVTATLFMDLQGIPMFLTYLAYVPLIKDLLKRIETFMTRFKNPESKETFERLVMVLAHVRYVSIVLYTFGAFLMTIYPFFVYFFTGTWTIHFGFQLPYFDPATVSGYIANFIYSLICIFAFHTGMITTIPLTFILFMASFGQFNIIKILIDDLNVMMKENKKGEKDKEIHEAIGVIIEMHNDLIE